MEIVYDEIQTCLKHNIGLVPGAKKYESYFIRGRHTEKALESLEFIRRLAYE